MGKISEAEIYSQFSVPGGILKEAERSAAVAVDQPGQEQHRSDQSINSSRMANKPYSAEESSDLSCLT
jgi:hypothetical protein